MNPTSGLNDGKVFIANLAGTGFRVGATVFLKKSGTDITATNVTVNSPYKITCDVNLVGAEIGEWDIEVTNDDGQYGTLTNAFSVEFPAPMIMAITPDKGVNNGTVFISAINGSNFRDGASVYLHKNTEDPIYATSGSVNVESPTKINCTFDLTGKDTGYWDVVVENTDEKSGTLLSGFEVSPQPPVADFIGQPSYGTAPLTVQFTDLSTSSPFLWAWNFGDGATSVGFDQQNPVHTYQNPGIYPVFLQVTNKGGTSQVTKLSYIRVVSTPIANFTAEPMSGSAPLLVQFTDTSDGDPTKWYYTFGDGGSSIEQNPYYLYENPGTYTVNLTVYSETGSDTVTKSDLIVVTSIPVAEFTANRTGGTSPLTVQFTDLSKGVPTSWFWIFGDGGNSSEQNPVHTFASPGTYSVKLEVANMAGNSKEIKIAYITVGENLIADFDYQPSNPDNTAPLTVAFTDRSLGNPLMWAWSFGDGYKVNQMNPIHNYPNPGIYNVTLTVTDLWGSDSVTKTLTVKSPLRAEFFVEPTTGSAPLTVVLTDTSIGQPVQRYWIITKGTEITLLNPGEQRQTYTINEPGLYSVVLHVEDAVGSVSELEKDDYINVLSFPK